ncbi:MAG TPA: amidohydrolase family protein [Candidatus Acidoferrales bacterium]|nr:amidohydrolase family protein [Candidatus Acidoferrales bacterium]
MEDRSLRRKRVRLFLWLGCVLAANPVWAQAGRGLVIFADAVYYNGKVLTVDERFSVAEALAVRDGRVMAVGSNAEILNLAGPHTRRLDLKGKTIIPGLIDTHSHLFDYAPANWASDLEVLEPELKQYRQVEVQAQSVDDAIAQLKAMAAQSPPGNMIHVQLQPSSVAEEFGKKVMLEEMDKLAPNHPMVVQLRGTDRRANSRVFKMFTDYFGELPEDIQADGQGRPRGPIGSGAMRTLVGEILVRKPQTLAHIYKKELQAWAAQGVTTWSSSLPSVKVFNAFVLLDQSGEMPIRFAYSHRMGAAGFSQAAEFYKRLGNIAGHGTDFLWAIGVSLSSLDSSYPRHCTTIAAPAEIKSRERCEAEAEYKIMRAAVQSGQRISGTHVYGDGAVDRFLDTLEKAASEAGLSLEEIRARRHNIDHCGMSPRPDQIERAKKLNIIWSCAPRYIEDAADISRDYGEKYAHELNAPIQNILRAGGKVVMEMDDRRLHRKEGGSFAHIKYAVTRKDSQGRTWGAKQAVDKATALKMFTRWAAEYVLREKQLGSLEPGKWADFVILDRDYLATPDEELTKINVLMTAVGGKAVYVDPEFAKAETLQAAGLKLRPAR